MQKVLIVEDEPRISSVLRDYLQKAGFSTQEVEDGGQVMETFQSWSPDLLLLDIMLPNVDGLTLCKEVRKISDVPIILISARVEELDRLLGLELGADDYICKPFSPREVVARAKANLRRWSQEEQESTPLIHHPDRQSFSSHGTHLQLTPTEYRLLDQLYTSPSRVFSRAQLLDTAYDPDQEVSDRVIDSHIKNLRRKLAQVLPGRELIHSVYGVGYRFEW